MLRRYRTAAFTSLALALPIGFWAARTGQGPAVIPVPLAEEQAPQLPPLPAQVSLVDRDRTLKVDVSDLGIDPEARTFDGAKAKEGLEKVARKVDYLGVNSKLVFKTNSRGREIGWSIKPSKLARRMNVSTMLAALRDWAGQEAPPESLKLPMELVPPRVPAEELKKVKTIVASFSTRYNPGDRPRTHNLRLVSERLDGAVVMPGEVFSFNGQVGPRTKGFREAKIYVRGKIKTDLGGGTCQVSTTLYNATLLAGLSIVERNHHSLTVPYIEPGKDATVYYGSLDYRFRNTTDAPIVIRSVARGGRLRISLYGAAPPPNPIEVVSSVRWRNGKAYATVYRVVKQDGRVIRKERLHRNVYGRLEDAVQEYEGSRRRS